MRGMLIGIVIVLALVSTANAATIYVNETGWWFEGGGFNPSDTPIQSAVNNASDGDTIYIEPGQYYIDSTIDIPKAVNVIGDGSPDQIVIEATANIDVFNFHDKNYPSVKLKNLTVIGGSKPIHVDDFNFLTVENVNVTTNNYGVYIDSSSVRVSNSKISAIWAVLGIDGSCVEVIGCQIDASTGVSLGQSSGLISNNRIHGRISLGSCSGVAISNNIIEYSGSFSYTGTGIYITGSSGVTIYNNTLIALNLYTTGIYIGTSTNFEVKENKIRDSKTGIRLSSSTNGYFENNEISNCVYNLEIYGSEVSHYIHTMIGNTVDSKPVYYYVNQSGVTVPSDAGFIGIVNSKNVVASDFSISNGYYGVLIVNSSNVDVKGYVYNCLFGVYIRWSDSVKFSGEIYKDDPDYMTGDGVCIEDSTASVLNTKISQTGRYVSSDGIYAKRSSIALDNVTMSGYFVHGIYFDNCENCQILNSKIEYDEIHLSYTSNSLIHNCSLSNGARIYLYGSDYNTIEECELIGPNWLNGINIQSSDRNTIRSNEIRDYSIGIRLYSGSDYNKIVGNIIESNGKGVVIEVKNENNVLDGNIVRSNTFGIEIIDSTNTTMRNNVLGDNDYNFGVKGSKLGNFIHDIDTTNTVNGRPIYYLVNQSGVTLDSASNAGYVGVVNSENIVIKDLSMGNNVQCVLMAYSRDCIIDGVTVSNCSFSGIDLESSAGIEITNCEAYDCDSYNSAGIKLFNSTACTMECYSHDNFYGAYLEDSNRNSIKGEFVENVHNLHLRSSSFNTISGNFSDGSCYGIHLTAESNNNAIENSTVIRNSNGGIVIDSSHYNEVRNCNVSLTKSYDGIGISYTSSHNRIENCTITKNNGYCGRGVYISGDENVIANGTIGDNGYGVYIYSGEENAIFNNTISNNDRGVYVRTQHNIIAFNDITDNDYGVYLTNSYNEIYLNDFVDNGVNAYSSGVNTWRSFKAQYTYNGNTFIGYLGNYWDDYNGTDSNGDGIGDTNYSIDNYDDIDSYPLIAPNENYENVKPAPPPKFNVSGSIDYEGYNSAGTIYVIARNATTNEIVNYTSLSATYPYEYPKSYSFKLQNGEYHIEAYMDMNENGVLDEGEPWGYAINKNPYSDEQPDTITVSGADIPGIDIALMRPPPVITSYSPDANVVYNYEGDSRWFEVSTYTRLASGDRKVDVTWTINGTIVQTDSDVTSSRYTNTSAKAGVWVVKAIVSDPYGSDEHEWIWKVYPPSQQWFLTGDTNSGNYVMYKQPPATASSTYVTIAPGSSALWIANESAKGNITFPEATWFGFVWKSGETTIDVSVGVWDGSTFTAYGSRTITLTSEEDYVNIEIPMPTFTVHKGEHLAFKIENTGSSDLTVKFKDYYGWKSYIAYPSLIPSYPIPEPMTTVLVGLGLILIAAIIMKKRY